MPESYADYYVAAERIWDQSSMVPKLQCADIRYRWYLDSNTRSHETFDSEEAAHDAAVEYLESKTEEE